MNYYFEIKGKINAETIDDAVDILQLLLEDNSITITGLDVSDKKKEISVSIPRFKPIHLAPSLVPFFPNIPCRYPPKQKQKLEGKGAIKRCKKK